MLYLPVLNVIQFQSIALCKQGTAKTHLGKKTHAKKQNKRGGNGLSLMQLHSRYADVRSDEPIKLNK